mmetsp:Transcript_24244/g.79829  ORF Transcript_24244/g.79829 Transcript_24244/m.79829 type:complete len:290 (-) Transcript_24244:91-960(-)
MHPLVDVLVVAASHGEHALHPVDVDALVAQQRSDPRVSPLHVELAAKLEADRGDCRVVLVLAVGEELWVHLQHPLELEGADPHHLLERDRRVLASANRRELVDLAQPLLEPLQVRLLRHQVDLVEQEAVGESNLLDRLVLGALGLLLVEVLLDVLRVDEGDDPVELEGGLDHVVDEEGLGDGRRVGHACCLDDDAVELERAGLDALGELLEHDDQVLPDGAADAAVHHLDDLLVRLHLRVLLKQHVIDANVAELILDDGDLLAVLCGEDVVEQGGLPAPKEAGEYRHWD